MYGIAYKTGLIEKQEGNNFMDAYKKTKNVLPNGEVNFSILDFYFLVPVPMNLEQTQKNYQLYLMKDKNSNWEEFEKPTNQLFSLQLLLGLKVKREGFFSAIIVDLETEKPIEWVWR